jgi:hypothetical protein
VEGAVRALGELMDFGNCFDLLEFAARHYEIMFLVHEDNLNDVTAVVKKLEGKLDHHVSLVFIRQGHPSCGSFLFTEKVLDFHLHPRTCNQVNCSNVDSISLNRLTLGCWGSCCRFYCRKER